MEVFMNIRRFLAGGLVAIAFAPLSMDAMPGESGRARSPTAELFVFGLQGASGSTIGPDGALYVTEGAVGRISRVDLSTGAVTTFASGLPESIIGIGGAIDVAFIGTPRTRW